MVRIATKEARDHLAELVLRASRGETILITESGQPVAKLTSVDNAQQASMTHEQVLLSLRDIRSRTTLAPNESLKDLIAEGRKY
ncbi:MAG: type II toxin-antitoxin system prevent-host-death family antitoxin [Tepidisphaeraceae bacterium]|jgi:prevent-host-death family protein